MKKKLWIVIFTIILTAKAFAATRDIQKIKEDLTRHSSAVSKLAAQIKHLDKKLSDTNTSYINKAKSIEKIENKIAIMQKELEKSANLISKEYQDSQKALNLYLLEASDEDNEDALAHREIYLELFKQKLSKLKSAQQISKQMLETINLYDQKLTETKSNEEIVYKLIVELENKKKEMSQEYLDIMENKNELESELDKYKAQKIAYRKVYKENATKQLSTIPMDIPLESFVSAKQSKTAIILKFSDITPIKAPSSGKIAYTGELASYGNVVIIDHGNDVRSVIFGDMKIKASKGDLVKQADIIGYTMADPGIEKSLYYEIRKKNIAQNTIQWISSSAKESLRI